MSKINIDFPPQPSFIGAYMLDDISLCDEFINYFYQNTEKQHEGQTQKFGSPYVDKSIKESIDVGIYFNDSSDVWQRYIIENQRFCLEYAKEFQYADGYSAWGINGYSNIQYYPPSGGYKKWHTERTCTQYEIATRHLVFMTYLNDISDGGETEFLYQKIKIKPIKGLTLIWPADWTHTHRGLPSLTEEKYILTGWYNFLE